MRRFTLLIICFVAILLPGFAAAQDRAIRWDRFDIAVDVQPNGDLQFTETQRLLVDSGQFRFGTRTFKTGDNGRVRGVQVSENGRSYRPGSDQPGTFTASDNGQQFNLRYFFLDPNATTHDITVQYAVGRALVDNGGQAQLSWSFFCASGCPRIDNGSVTIRLPEGNTGQIKPQVTGAAVRQTQSGATTRWELTGPIQNNQLGVTIQFPRSLLGQNALFRSSGGAAAPNSSGNTSPVSPSVPVNGVAAPSSSFSPIFCLIVLVVLFMAFSIIRSSARRRGYQQQGPAMGPMPDPMVGGPVYPRQRRRWWGRRYNDWDNGWGSPYGPVPPVIITPPLQPPMDYGSPFNQAPPQDTAPGGGGSFWDDSGGGGSSWNDAGGGGSFWNDAGGGGSSWGDAGGGGSSWGGGDSGGGGGSGDSSSFG